MTTMITTVALFTCCCYGICCQPIRWQLSNDVGQQSSYMLKSVQQKSADKKIYNCHCNNLLSDIHHIIMLLLMILHYREVTMESKPRITSNIVCNFMRQYLHISYKTYMWHFINIMLSWYYPHKTIADGWINKYTLHTYYDYDYKNSTFQRKAILVREH